MTYWSYIGDEKKIRALTFAEEVAQRYATVGINVTYQEVYSLAEFLFPSAFRSINERLKILARVN